MRARLRQAWIGVRWRRWWHGGRPLGPTPKNSGGGSASGSFDSWLGG